MQRDDALAATKSARTLTLNDDSESGDSRLDLGRLGLGWLDLR